MRVDIRDAEALRAVRPMEAALYLRSAGWRRSDLVPHRESVWLRETDSGEFEILLPMDPKLHDYSLRVGELLRTLADAEKRSQAEIYSDLLTATSDVTRIRIIDSDLSDGAVPIEEHAEIAQRARDLILAAACAATERRPVWHSRKPPQAVDYVRRVRVGQTERGSYILTILSQVTPALHSPDDALFEMAPPFERQVTETLAASLGALGNAAEQAALTQELSTFDDAVAAGVSANLCDAVVGLGGRDDFQRTLEFSFTWSAGRPMLHPVPSRVTFAPDSLPVIREASRLMRERAPLIDFELSGAVIKLDRPDGSPTGKVTVMGIVDSRPVRVLLELSDPDYSLAITAHSTHLPLHARGILHKDGRSFALKAPNNVEVEGE